MVLHQAPVPSDYLIREVTFECPNCGCSHTTWLPFRDELVKFVAIGGGEERWLPTFGPGGYLEILPVFVPGYVSGMPITEQVRHQFDAAFRLYQEPNASGKPFAMCSPSPVCPACGSFALRETSESVLQAPPVRWMRYQLP